MHTSRNSSHGTHLNRRFFLACRCSQVQAVGEGRVAFSNLSYAEGGVVETRFGSIAVRQASADTLYDIPMEASSPLHCQQCGIRSFLRVAWARGPQAM